MKVGDSIKKLREFKGFKQETIAEHLKISQASYSKLENDEAEITLTRLQEIANFLNVELADIIGFDKSNFIYNSNNNSFNSTINDIKMLENIISAKDKVIQALETQIGLIELLAKK